MSERDAAGQILLYRSEDGRTKLDVRLDGGTVWLSQRRPVSGMRCSLALAVVLVACDAAHLPSDDAMQLDASPSSVDGGSDEHDTTDAWWIDAGDAATCDGATFLGPGPVRSCTATTDCGSFGICSHVCAGCGDQGVCVPQRMWDFPETFCGCDGTTFTTEVCFNGIPHAWVHMGPC